MRVTRQIGERLAAYADGEGCFSIARRVPSAARKELRPGARETYGCAFRIKLRADDLALLEHLRNATGIGRTLRHRAYADPHRQNNASATWSVDTKADCLALVAILERYPLWSKKARDFEVWARAVRYWNAPTTSPRTGRGNQFWVDQQPLAELHAELSAARRYAA